MTLRQRNQCRCVFLDTFALKIVIIEASKSSQFSCLSPFLVRNIFPILLIQAHIVQIFFDIRPLYHIQNGKGKFSNLHFMAITVFLMEKFKEKSNIIGISQSGSGGSIRLNSTEKISAEAGERIQNLAEF